MATNYGDLHWCPIASGKSTSKKVGPTTPAVVRYSSPNGEEWCRMGRRRQLAWMKKALQEGKSTDDFAV